MGEDVCTTPRGFVQQSITIKVAHDTYLVLTVKDKLKIVFMTDEEVMKYLIEVSNGKEKEKPRT